MVPVGTQTIAFGPLCGDDGPVIELLYKEETDEFFGYTPELPMAFRISLYEAKALMFSPKTKVIKKVFCGKYPSDE